MESVVSYRILSILSCIDFRISIYDGPIGASPAMTSPWRKKKEGVWHQSVRLHYMNTTAMHRQSFIPPSPWPHQFNLLGLAYESADWSFAYSLVRLLP